MRKISFFLTRPQVLARIKRVTRRVGWDFAMSGMKLQPVEKCQGLKAGEHQVPLGCQIILVSVRKEPLTRLIDDPAYGAIEAALEGFPGWTGQQFVDFICKQPGVYPARQLNRLEFDYLGEA